MAEIERRLALIETRLQQLFTHLQVAPRKHPSESAGEGWWGGGEGAPPEVSDRVRELVDEGKKLEAIKLHREETGLGLKEAQDAIEQL